MNARLTDPQAIRDFILAGSALFTLQNTETENRYTYRVRNADMEHHSSLYFVSVLRGSENESDYSYLGCIAGKNFKHTAKSKFDVDSQPFKAFTWLWDRIRAGKGLPEQVEFWHAGRCARCGRVLTTPESCERGIGPECLKLTTGLKQSLD